MGCTASTPALVKKDSMTRSKRDDVIFSNDGDESVVKDIDFKLSESRSLNRTVDDDEVIVSVGSAVIGVKDDESDDNEFATGGDKNGGAEIELELIESRVIIDANEIEVNVSYNKSNNADNVESDDDDDDDNGVEVNNNNNKAHTKESEDGAFADGNDFEFPTSPSIIVNSTPQDEDDKNNESNNDSETTVESGDESYRFPSSHSSTTITITTPQDEIIDATETGETDFGDTATSAIPQHLFLSTITKKTPQKSPIREGLSKLADDGIGSVLSGDDLQSFRSTATSAILQPLKSPSTTDITPLRLSFPEGLSTSADENENKIEDIDSTNSNIVAQPSHQIPTSSTATTPLSVPPSNNLQTDLSKFSGSWLQIHHINLPFYLSKTSPVPLPFQKVLARVIPRQVLNFTADGYEIKVYAGLWRYACKGCWGVEREGGHVLGVKGGLVLDYVYDDDDDDDSNEDNEDGDENGNDSRLTVYHKFTTRNGVDVGSRRIVNGELRLTLGPKIVNVGKRGEVETIKAVRVFKRVT